MQEVNLNHLVQRIEKVELRNTKVEAEKAWETSIYRKILIIIATYIIMIITMFSIGVKDFYTQAIIPTLGYFLSTLSFKFFKNYYLTYIIPRLK